MDHANIRQLIEHITSCKELLGFMAAGLGAISFLPQVIKIWRLKSVRDISTIAYILYTLSVILWLLYGVIMNSKSLIISSLLTLILVTIILFMKYLYKV